MEKNPNAKRIYCYTTPVEFKVVTLKECPIPTDLFVCENAERAVAYWNMYIQTSVVFNPECECLAVVLLNARRRIKGHQFLTIGTMDTLLTHPREIFRTAILAAAHALVVMHNHPSGDPSPSESDIKVTRDLVRAGQLIRIEVVDHIIVGGERHTSLRDLGFFYS